jgi:hypothetical protein
MTFPISQHDRAGDHAPPLPFGVRFLEAVGWAVLCSIASMIASFVALFLSSAIFPRPASVYPVLEAVLVLFSGLVGFMLAGAGRLARPRWTTMQVLVLAGLIALGCGATTLGCDLMDARQPGARMPGQLSP